MMYIHGKTQITDSKKDKVENAEQCSLNNSALNNSAGKISWKFECF